METWTDIPGYEGVYLINKDGIVKAFARTYKCGVSHNTIKHIPEYNPKISINPSGYLVAFLSKNGTRFIFPIHRLIALTFLPNPEKLPEVNHINGNKRDNRVENLEWISRSENLKHAYRTGLKVVTHTKGGGNGRAILNEAQVRDIKTKISNGVKTKVLAKAYNVKRHVINFIKMNKTWAHVI